MTHTSGPLTCNVKETNPLIHGLYYILLQGYSPPGINMAILLPLSNISSSFVIRRPSGVISLKGVELSINIQWVWSPHNSVTSSNTILTKSSNPNRVPTISLSDDFIII